MRALRLALSLVLIPRLFATLFLFPLLLSFLIVYAQLVVTGVVLRATDSEPEALQQNFKAIKKNNLARRILFGSSDPLPAVKVCRWKIVHSADGTESEAPPDAACSPDRLDVAVHVSDPEHYDPSEYVTIFDGNVERLHICRTCHPDAVIDVQGDHIRSDIYSVWGGLVLHLARYNDAAQEAYLRAIENFHHITGLMGEVYLNTKGFSHPTRLSGVKEGMAVIFNVASLVVLSLWLALKAHRKVLDYFARSGALLPMVAATGKSVFYSALWILTLARVGAFLAGSVPFVYEQLSDAGVEGDLFSTFDTTASGLALWVVAIIASLGLATIIASIADLKHRHGLLSFTYKYIPIAICSVGAVVWSMTFIFEGSAIPIIRNVTASLPIIGMAPIIVAPMFEPGHAVLLIHAVLTVSLIVFALKHNARWFAAHLEDL
jgi:hypothetical protein